MTPIAIIGAGAFGTAMAITLSSTGRPVMLWSRDTQHANAMAVSRENTKRLPGRSLPDSIQITDQLSEIADCDTALLCIPMQRLSGFLIENGASFGNKALIACCKGVDIETMQGPSAVIARTCPTAMPAVLTGPSFADDIAKGLPTALTLACADADAGRSLQQRLSTPTLRLYRTTDTTGAELGGALKNVIAIAAGIVIGAGLGESARAALMTRGFAEIQRFVCAMGGQADTLAGLSGFGDLVLTCTSDLSRNYRYGLSLGRAAPFDASVTVEGAATAFAVSKLAKTHTIDLPIVEMVAAVLSGACNIEQATAALLSRPLKEE